MTSQAAYEKYLAQKDDLEQAYLDKNLSEQDKIKILEALWSIVYSNKEADMYETNLMRRLAGLLYIDNKTMGDIKEKIKQNSK